MEQRLEELAQRIRRLREMLKLSQETMAIKTGIPLEQYKRYENGGKDFPFTFLCACSRVFSMDVSELLAGERLHSLVRPKQQYLTIRERNSATAVKFGKGKNRGVYGY